MTAVLPMRYEGNGMFRCLRPKQITLETGSVHGWQMSSRHRSIFASGSLIKAGFCTETKIVCANNSEALSLVVTARNMDKFAVVEIDGKTVTIWRADSQRKDVMGRERFQEAKEKALDVLSQLIGTDATTLRNAA